jgi:16S rRNA (uracil1498-N3)-methyltransferase
MARRRFFVDRIENGKAVLRGADAHHFGRVLRAEPGQRIEVSDRSRAYLAEVESVRESITVRVVEALPLAPQAPGIRLLAALIKFDRFEWLVEKATELGVDEIVPVAAERSDKGLFEGAAKRIERWRKIAQESSRQSRRTTVPELDPPARLACALEPPATVRYWLDECGGTPLAGIPRDSGLALAVGPEGGWTDREREAFRAAHWLPAGLGHSVLRAETAGIAALAIVAHARWAESRTAAALETLELPEPTYGTNSK